MIKNCFAVFKHEMCNTKYIVGGCQLKFWSSHLHPALITSSRRFSSVLVVEAQTLGAVSTDLLPLFLLTKCLK